MNNMICCFTNSLITIHNLERLHKMPLYDLSWIYMKWRVLRYDLELYLIIIIINNSNNNKHVYILFLKRF